MMIADRIQTLIHATEVGGGSRWLKYISLAVALVALVGFYDLRAYRNFYSPEAMDVAQVARNVAEGRGYTTEFIRPFSLYLVQKHNRAGHPGEILSTNAMDFAQINRPHPDLANAPVYPTVLAGLMKVWPPDWKVQLHKPFWSEGGRFMRYKAEFRIAIFNQILLLAVVALTFLLAKKLFDGPAAWLAALLTLGSDLLWKFSVSGLSTMLLLVIFLGLIWCICKIEENVREEDGLLRSNEPIVLGETNRSINLEEAKPRKQLLGVTLEKRRMILAIAAGALVGIGMLTRYSFGWLIVPVVVFFTLFGGTRRTGLAAAAMLAFAVVVSPWIARNLVVSGTLFGTAGYAVAEGTFVFPGTNLMQSLNPNLNSVYGMMPYVRKFAENTRYILQNGLLQANGVWVGALFFAGLLLGLRNLATRRLRYFTMMCLGVFIIAEALGRTQLSIITPEMNSENLLALLTPLVAIFGVAFFLTLLNQMNVPTPQVRYGVIALLAVIACQPLIGTLVSKASPVAYPPYYPPDIQKIAGWMRPDELTMSDVPWAVAWYGDRQCTWTTINSQYEFFALNDYLKPVHALYLTLGTMDARLVTECLQGGVDSWGNFVLKTVAANQIPSQFPLKASGRLSGFGLFLTDRQRWASE